MTPAERNYGTLLLLWARTLEDHGMSFEAFIIHKAAERRKAREAACTS